MNQFTEPPTRTRAAVPSRRRRAFFALLATLLAAPMVAASIPTPTAQAAPVGQGFAVTAADLSYILEQIQIGEWHVANTTSTTGPCGALVGPGAHQIANPLLSFGIRTVDGSCNNLQAGQETFGASDQAFPRLTQPSFQPAEDITPSLPVGPPGPTSYAQTTGSVVDSEPRTVSNLIVDQTSDNPAAVAAAGFPVRTQGNEGVVVCTDPPTIDPATNQPVPCVPEHETLFIPNVTTDVGLSPPFNGLFAIFGQFFDHGLDKITNGGAGTVFVPLKDDDPLVTRGPDGIAGNGDEVPPGLRFMTLSRGTIVTGPDGFRSALNTDTPFVDQSQTYTSHGSHQFFLREYQPAVDGHPVTTGKFLSSADDGHGMADWNQIRAQASAVLGMQLVDTDVNDIPLIATDPYGNFIPGTRGFPQAVFPGNVLVEGDPSANGGAGISLVGAVRIGTAFLNDIAHSAGPGSTSQPKLPDAVGVAGGSLDPVAPGEYDDELLGLHAICGDGRCNENIALQAVHQIFHSEHDRLVDDILGTLHQPGNEALLARYEAIDLATGPNQTFEFGERIFQAARFVTEMEYQHLVFEEFARKVQPAINPFEPFAFNQTDVNPAITAEFAHAVYRFGHSMLTETIDRVNADGSRNDILLLDGFLNPAEYFRDGSGGTLTSRDAATSIFMGMSDQVGNEIDEFVTNTLRNNLLGLPLDLASLNMARARSEGIPSLNNVRKQIYASTNDGQLAPYENWVAFGQGLKHPESLINFVAAYGTHPTILFADGGLDLDFATIGDNAPATLASRRAAATLIVAPGTTDVPPVDAADFLFSTGAWANQGNSSTTGLDDVDLWVGGLAENTNVFGGLLGSTFNYVFENQLTNLQNGDRFYYLARTPGMNLRTQLEGNSFSELVMRNTDAYALKADPFATADCKFQLGDLTWPAASGSFITGPGSVNDVIGSDCDENRLLLRQPTGRVEYRSINSVDPSGINGQSVYDGTAGVDRIYGGNDNDTFWGRESNDIIDGRGGDDIVLGGEGDDIITDFAGFDVLKGGPGNDAIDGGINDDILMAGEGNDFTNGGANLNETFLGDGDDFAIAGQGLDAVFGDSGDDWEEGGDMADLLMGDSSSLFFDDHNLPGHDVTIGLGGDDDYDAEGGDDILVAGPGVEKNAGASGYDWSIGVNDPQRQVADLNLKILPNGQPAIEVRDRFNEVEALSGWNMDDELHGDDLAPSGVAGAGAIGCDVLNQAGLDRISGLDALVPTLATPAAGILDSTTTRYCLIDRNENVWGDGNILLGGAGNDILEGRGADDILDGDKFLNVRISVREPGNPAAEIGSTDLMEHTPLSGNFGPNTTGMTLQQAVFAGLVNPGQLVIVREILNPGPGTSVDVAWFSGPSADYDITWNTDGSVTVAHTRGTAADGIDTLWNIEQFGFCELPGAAGVCDQRVPVDNIPPPPAPVAEISVPAGLTTFLTLTGTSTAPEIVTVTNTGNLDLVISAVALMGGDPGDFTIVSDLCTGVVAPGASCDIGIAFTPGTPGLKVALLDIAHNADGGDLQAVLLGTATAPVATVTAPAAVTAFTAIVGTTSAAQVVTVTNDGDALLNVSSATVGGTDPTQFTIPSNGCTVVAPGASCAITVAFRPTTAGAKAAQLVIAHDAGADSVVALAGTGTAPIASITAPAALTTFTAAVGGTSTSVNVTVTNTGTANLQVNGATLGGTNPTNFAITNNCTVAIAPAGSCTIAVVFRPLTTGPKSAQLTISHNAGANSVVALAGTTLAGPPAPAPVMVLPATTDFGTRRVGTTRTQAVRITNQGPGVLTIGTPTATGRFTVNRGTCGATLAVGRSCKLNVTFAPNAVGPTSGTLTVPSNAVGNPRTAGLTGTGR
ncbi:MAG: choice-of-anchor D domain-containing protein [Actinobacteria bacterium]|nr:choice-of-anchor D domain-containing protein [Actinomycetota bacterium]